LQDFIPCELSTKLVLGIVGKRHFVVGHPVLADWLMTKSVRRFLFGGISRGRFK